MSAGDYVATPASVTVVAELTGTQAITGATAPAKGVTPVSSVSAPANTTASIKWYKDGESTELAGSFAGETVYKAVINIKPNTGYVFADGVSFTVDGASWTAAKQSDGSYNLSKTFPATAGKNPLQGSVTIDNTSPKYGQTLTAQTGSLNYNGEGADTLSYQWYRGTTAISGANSNTYNVVGADIGQTIKVEVKNSNNSGSVFSAATAAVAKADYSGAAATAAAVTKTANSVTVTNVITGQEYAITTGSSEPTGGWNTTGTFTGQSANTAYKVYTRVAATATTKASAAVSTDVTTDKASGSLVFADGSYDITYDGSAVEAGTSGKDLNYTYTGDGAVTVKWYNNNSGSVGSVLGTAPTNAGIYWIGVSAAEGTNTAAVAEVTHQFTITPKSINGANITLGTIPTYDNGTEKQVTISSVVVGGLTLTTGDYDISAGTDKATNVASKDLKITGKGNFTGTATKSWSLQKATPGVGDFTITTDLTKDYTGSPISVAAPTTSKPGMGSVTVKYNSSTTPPTNAGSYTVTFAVSEGQNYKATTTDITIGTLTINKINYTGTTTASDTVRSGQTTTNKTLVLPVLPDGAIYAATGTLGGATALISDHGISGTTLTYSTTSQSDGTTATITINVTGATNYNNYDVVVTIKAEDKTELTISGVTMGESSYVYGGTAVTYNNEGLTISGGSFDASGLKYIYSGTPDDGTTFTTGTTAPTKAGSYKLTVQVPDDNADYMGKQEISFTIGKKSVTITGLSASNKVYDGNTTATPTGAAEIVGKLTGDTVTVSDGSASFADKTVGTGKTVTFTGYSLSGADADNYSLSGQPASVTAAITAKSVTITGVTATNRGYAAGNTTVALTGGTIDGVISGDTVTVDLSGATGTIATADAEDDKTVTVTGAALGGADAGNYRLSAQPTGVTVDISKAIYDGTKTGEISVPSTGSDNNRLILPALPEGAAYATEIILSQATKAGEADKTLFPSGGTTWSEDGNSLTFKTEPCPEGYKATMTFSVTDATNYQNYNVIVTVKVVNKLSAALTVTQSDCTYGETLAEPGYTKPAGTIDSAIAVTYKGRDGTIYAESATKPTDAGNYEVTVKCETETHIYTGTSDFTINKATPTGTPTYTAITTSGKTLADAALTVGSIVPAGGSIAWDLGNSQTISANTAYNWTYTPADPANYNNLTGSITPYVVSYSGGGGGVTTYSITVDSAKNGTITVSPKGASKGMVVTVTVKPDEGYELDALTVTDGSGKAVTVTEKDGKYTFTMPASQVTVTGTFAEIEQPVVSLNPFTDVKEGDFFYDAVLWAVESGITEGTSATTFSPNATCTRAQAVTFLWRAAGSPAPKSSVNPFTDVKADSYYYDAVLWAVENGITNGNSATTFSPDATCTRSQIVTFLWRAQKSPAAGTANPFTDVAAEAYYADAVNWAVAQKITNGTSNNAFSPDATCTRGQIVTFLYRWIVK